MRMVHEKRWEQLFQLKPRKAESEIRPEHASLALAAQIVLEEILLRIVQTAQKLTGCSNLCLAGGVALKMCIRDRFNQDPDPAANYQQLFLDKTMNSEAIFVKAFASPDKAHNFPEIRERRQLPL